MERRNLELYEYLTNKVYVASNQTEVGATQIQPISMSTWKTTPHQFCCCQWYHIPSLSVKIVSWGYNNAISVLVGNINAALSNYSGKRPSRINWTSGWWWSSKEGITKQRRQSSNNLILTGTHVINWNSFWQSGQRFVMVAQLSMHVKQNLNTNDKPRWFMIFT